MEPFVVNYAKFFETRLVDAKNNFHNVVTIKKAKELARESGLDLVCFNEPERNQLALCKIIDYGKWKYHNEKAKKKNEQQSKKEVKEIHFTPVISDNDVGHKVRQIKGFLEDGDDVVVLMVFRGIHHRLVSEGERIVSMIVDMCKEVGKEIGRKKSGDNIVVRLTKA